MCHLFEAGKYGEVNFGNVFHDVIRKIGNRMIAERRCICCPRAKRTG
jgi:hypothetical protein